MRALNIILVIVLIAYTAFNLAVIRNVNNKQVEWQLAIDKQKRINDVLIEYNDSLDNVNVTLLDSIEAYKAQIVLYNDSIANIKDKYKNIENEVSSLSDSMSVIYFHEYITNHATRFYESGGE